MSSEGKGKLIQEGTLGCEDRTNGGKTGRKQAPACIDTDPLRTLKYSSWEIVYLGQRVDAKKLRNGISENILRLLN